MQALLQRQAIRNLPQVSDWSHPQQTPSKVGVYEIKPDHPGPHRMYAHWDGAAWSAEMQTPEAAEKMHGYGRTNQQVTWRGIVK